MPEYLNVVEVLALHAILIDEFGGTDGVRDLGALESAVFRPQTGYYEDPIAEAAALLESLVQNHPFLDGNKRVAVAAADVHLRLHGFELAGDSMEHHRFLVGLMEIGAMDWKAIDTWLRKNVESFSRLGRDLSAPLTKEETDWLDADLD